MDLHNVDTTARRDPISDQNTINMALNSTDVPELYRELYSALYKKISSMIMGRSVVNLKTDPTLIKICIETTMTLVENFSGAQKLTGPEKKHIALEIIKCTFAQLSQDGKIDPHTAAEIINNIDMWGGIAMDIAIDAAKMAFYVGVKIKDEAVEFVADAKKIGCKQSCKKNCCCCFF